MQFAAALTYGRMVRRYKRFLADILLDESGEEVTAHCANSGSMKGLVHEGGAAALSRSDNPKRKLAWTLELVSSEGAWVGVNTGLANRIAEEALQQGWIREVAGFAELKREVPFGDARLDFRLTEADGALTYLEVKSVTLRLEGEAAFPDAVTKRGQKHLGSLTDAVKAGHRGVILFIVQRSDCDHFRPAHEIDPDYANLLKAAQESGVEILVYGCRVTPEEIRVERPLPYRLGS
uniref:Sugar fermentation stimulation protein homolog n=1 Tax=Magnetococcus massalia (strain MO-1) TaxID=451514 RepID=A0A1S7LLG2_MAGMO|nr:Sugar fermentation stimulation protein A [Candidatus Magnetococcus massalia]